MVRAVFSEMQAITGQRRPSEVVGGAPDATDSLSAFSHAVGGAA
jgi:hypothetical protein